MTGTTATKPPVDPLALAEKATAKLAAKLAKQNISRESPPGEDGIKRPKLNINDRVVVYGLARAAMYNARMGLVTSIEKDGRYGVELDWENPLDERGKKKTIRAKRENIERIPGAGYSVEKTIEQMVHEHFSRVFSRDPNCDTRQRIRSLEEIARIFADSKNPRTRDAFIMGGFTTPILALVTATDIAEQLVSELIPDAKWQTLRTTALYLCWRLATEPKIAYLFVNKDHLQTLVDVFLQHRSKLVEKRSEPLPKDVNLLHKVDIGLQNGAFAFSALAQLAGYRWGDHQKPTWQALWPPISNHVLTLCGTERKPQPEQPVCEHKYIRDALVRFASGILGQGFELKEAELLIIDRIAKNWQSRLLLGFLIKYRTTQ